MTIPRTERLVARRSLQMRLGPEVADWATEQLVQGYDTPHLRQLAGVSGTEGQGELEDLLDRTLRELGVTSPPPDAALVMYAQELARDHLDGRVTESALLAELCELCIATDYRRELHPFYLLCWTRDDLQDQTFSFYRQDVTRDNFTKILRDEIDTLLRIRPQTA